MQTNRSTSTEVRSLSDLNVGYAETVDRPSISVRLRREYRVGRYGLQYSTTGYGLRASQGNGGNNLHVVSVLVVAELLADFDAAESCRLNSSKRELENAERSPKLNAHGVGVYHHCNALKVGDLVAIEPVCVRENARGVAADRRQSGETGALDTADVTCRNCLVRVLGVPESALPDVEKIAAEKRGTRAANLAARPRCPNCGDLRPKTKATERGERLLCSACKDASDHVAEYTVAAETGKTREGYSIGRERAATLRDERAAELAMRRARGLRDSDRAPFVVAEVGA